VMQQQQMPLQMRQQMQQQVMKQQTQQMKQQTQQMKQQMKQQQATEHSLLSDLMQNTRHMVIWMKTVNMSDLTLIWHRKFATVTVGNL